MFIICVLCAIAAIAIAVEGTSHPNSDFAYWFDYDGGAPLAGILGFIALVTGPIGLCCKKDN